MGWIKELFRRAATVIPIVHIHEWEYEQACTGRSHYFSRKCSCGVREGLGKRKCGKSCNVYLKHRATVMIDHEKKVACYQVKDDKGGHRFIPMEAYWLSFDTEEIIAGWKIKNPTH